MGECNVQNSAPNLAGETRVRELKKRVGDQWIDLLMYLAPELDDACSKHPKAVACPVHSDCGGFVFHDDADVTGGARCRKARYADGIDLLSSLRGWSFPEVCRRIEGWLREPMKRTPPADPVDELNGKHFIVQVGGRVHVATEVVNPATGHTSLELGGPSDLSLLYANRSVKVGDKNVPLAELWISSPRRRQYAAVVFSPGREMPGYYNLWRGFSVDAVQGDCSLFWAHLREVICRGREHHFAYLQRWMAHMVQCPDELPEVAIVVRGSQGTGKTFFVNVLGSLLGQPPISFDSFKRRVQK